MLNEASTEERRKEARQRHMEAVALKRAKRKKRPAPCVGVVDERAQKRSGQLRVEKRVDHKGVEYHFETNERDVVSHSICL